MNIKNKDSVMVETGNRVNTFRLMCLMLLLMSFVILEGCVSLSTISIKDHLLDSQRISQQKQINKSSTLSSNQLALSFEPNYGQADEVVKFLAKGSGYHLYLTSDEAVLALQSLLHNAQPEDEVSSLKNIIQPKPSVLRMRFAGANSHVRLEGQQNLLGKINYFVGDKKNWLSDIPTFAKVKYKDLYSGIDMVYYGKQGQLEYDFVIAPGADPNKIRMVFEGSNSIKIDEDGNLVLTIGSSQLRQTKPYIYQNIEDVKKEISGSYVLYENGQVGFHVAAYEPNIPLIIDPVLEYSSYLGGQTSGEDQGNDIAVDSDGFLYITGTTMSNDFPTKNPLQYTRAGSRDVFVTKLDPEGTSFIYSTYLGGEQEDEGWGIAVDSQAQAYITGYTNSNDFPIYNALQPKIAGSNDSFITQLTANGAALGYSTYLGGEDEDFAQSIAVDSQGNAYVVGYTESNDFPTQNALQSKIAGDRDAFVSQLTRDGMVLGYSTYLGGDEDDEAQDIVVDIEGKAYVTGHTESDNFPAVNALQSDLAGENDGFIAEFTADGMALGYSTYLGGKEDDIATGIAIDQDSRIYVTGYTESTDFPIFNAVQSTFGGNRDVFISQIVNNGNGFGYSTYLGGLMDDIGLDIAVNSIGTAFVTGYTQSTNFPTVNAVQAAIALNSFEEDSEEEDDNDDEEEDDNDDDDEEYSQDAFITGLFNDGSALIYSTFLGGIKEEAGQGIAVDEDGNTYITGYTRSTDFPIENAIQTVLGGNKDGFVSHIALLPLSIQFTSPIEGSDNTDVMPTFEIAFQTGDLALDLNTFQLLINGVDVTATSIVTSTGASYTPTAPLSVGENTATAKISDQAGITKSTTVLFKINIGFRAIADCAPTNGSVPLTVRYRSRGEFDGGSIVRYRWDFQGDGTFDTNDTVARDFNFTFNQSGTFNAVLQVTNNLGDTATDTCPIIVEGNAPIATANVVPSNGSIPLDVSLTCAGSDPDGTIALYEWDFEGDGVFDFSSPISGNTTHTYTEIGIFTAVCRVTDNEGKTTEARTTTTLIQPAPPGSPSVEASATPSFGNGPLTVSLNGTANDDGNIVLWEWDFDGDGVYDFSSASSPVTSFTYDNGGIFAPALRVTDNDGQTGIDTVEVIVNLSATLSVSTDTFDPDAGQTGFINTSLSAGVPVRLVMKNQSGSIVRTLVDEIRTAGNYSDSWDGLDDSGNLLPEGSYFAVLEYDFFGEIRTIDLTNTTGGSRSSPPRTRIPSSFSPFAGQPLTIDFTLNRASEVLAFIGRFRVNTRLVTFLNRDPLGKGTHRITWNGDLAEGQLIHPPSGDRFLFGIFAFSLPSNAIYVRSGAHPSGLSVTPPIFDPSGHVDDQGTPERSTLTFSLNKPADVALIVNDATTGAVIANRTYNGLTSGQNTVFWDGRDDNGIFVAPGRYRLGIAAIDNTGNQSLKIYAVQRIYY